MRPVKGQQRRVAARRPEPVPVESWMPRVAWRSPMMVGAIAFLSLMTGAGLVQGGHLGIGGSASETASAGAWYPIEEILAAGHYHTRRKDLRCEDALTSLFPPPVAASMDALLRDQRQARQ